jgi:hypothetical protein
LVKILIQGIFSSIADYPNSDTQRNAFLDYVIDDSPIHGFEDSTAYTTGPLPIGNLVGNITFGGDGGGIIDGSVLLMDLLEIFFPEIVARRMTMMIQ